MAKGSMTSFGNDISMEIKNDEELLWQGVPQKASFVLSRSVQLLPIALLWLCFDGFAISMIFRANMPKSMLIFLIVFFAFHLMPVWMWIHQVLTARRKHKLIEYALTNQRVIVRNDGIIKSYYYKDLSHVSVKVGLIDRLFKVGDITLSGNRSITLLDIDNPYAIGNKLQQIVDSFAEVRRKEARIYGRDVEYEEYNEHDDVYTRSHDDSDYDGNEYEKPDYSRYSYKETQVASGRFTSNKMPPAEEKNQEDEYLDNIMDSINKKDEF